MLPTPDSGHQALRQTIPSRITGYGTQVRLAGFYVFFEEDSGISYDVVAFHHGLISSIDGYYLHDDVVDGLGPAIVWESTLRTVYRDTTPCLDLTLTVRM